MTSKLLLFSGGLQTKIAPHLVESTKALECINVDLDKGSIYPYGEWEASTDVATGNRPFYFDSTLITNSDATDNRSYATFGNRLYWSNGSFTAYGLMRWNGTTGVNAVPPTVTSYGALTLTPTGSNGALNETYAYVYTVIDTDGIESIPSDVYYTTPVNQDVSITIGADTVTETVSKRRIYRTGGSNPTFNLIAELDSPTLTYTDNTRDLDVSRIELTTFDNYAPPTDLDNLIECNATMWGSVGDRVYFSRNGQPEFWNPLDYVVLNEDCTGIGKFRDFIIAFTAGDAYIISGYTRDNIAIEKLPYNEGCLNHRSIANVSEYLIWTSKNGVCSFDGSNIEILTRNILSWTDRATIGDGKFDDFSYTFDADVGYLVKYALGVRGKYYAIHQNGISIINISDGVIVSNVYLENAESLYYRYDEGTINAIDKDFNIWMFNRQISNLEAVWKTPEIQDDGYHILKHYRRVKLDNVAESIKVTIDNKDVFTSNNVKEFYLPSGCIGRYIQFTITTTTEIRSLRYEYGVVNG